MLVERVKALPPMSNCGSAKNAMLPFFGGSITATNAAPLACIGLASHFDSRKSRVVERATHNLADFGCGSDSSRMVRLPFQRP